VIEKMEEAQIRHIPRVLYHWRTIKGSVAYSMDEKPYAHERARAAIREHFQRAGLDAEVVESVNHLHRVRYRMPEPRPRVSVIVFDAKRNAGQFERLGDEVLTATRSADELNSAVANARGSVLIFIDGDLWAPENVDELIATCLQPEIGAVSAKILNVNNVVEEAGLVVMGNLCPAFAHSGLPRTAGGNNGRNLLTSNFSAVSLSCLVISREKFESAGGFDSELPPSLIDVDLCLRLGDLDKRIVVLPHIEFIRQGKPCLPHYRREDMERLQGRWPAYIERDPFCNPNLKRDGTFEIDV
jgi:hypothetical protein